MSTLFQLSTTEGWIDIMNRGIDSVAIDSQPRLNENMIWALFYIAFIVLGNFLILNLFAGVVVSTFNREKEILGKNFLLTEK
jgi:Ion transport protein